MSSRSFSPDFLLCFLLLAQWLSHWTESATKAEQSDAPQSSSSAHYYLRVYALLALANSAAALFRSFIFALGGLVAAGVMFERLLRGVVGAPLSFFDTTPRGRIINRFSTDTYSIDENIPFQSNILLAQSFGLLGSLIVVAMVAPVVLLLLPILALFYVRMQRAYRGVSRELRRLDGVTRSPLYSSFTETLAGVTTLRAFGAGWAARAFNRAALDRNQRVCFVSLGLSQWLNIRLQSIGVSMIALVSFLAILTTVHPAASGGKFAQWILNPALIGLGIAYALPLTDTMNGQL